MQSLFSISSSVLLTLMGQDPSSAIKAPWFAYIFSLFRFLESFSTFFIISFENRLVFQMLVHLVAFTRQLFLIAL
jgi:hypothetical protein